LPHSVFVYIDEYQNLEGMIHISEISPGRIRNLRDFVKEGKKIVCKVLRIKRERNQIDLSLRRVNQSERIKKNNNYKQEQKAEKLLEHIGKKLNLKIEEAYKKIGYKVINEYESLYSGFQNFVLEPELISSLELDKKEEKIVLEIIQDKIKPPEVTISAFITIQNKNSNGIEIIKETLLKLKDNNLEIQYISAPKYKLTIKAPDYKTAESTFRDIQEKFEELIKKNKSTGEITKK